MPVPASRREAEALDACDPLAPFRAEFLLPDGLVYLDGNSLGPPSVAARDRVARTVETEWAEGLVRSWTTHGWIDLPARVAAAVAALIGAEPDEVVVADSTSVNLFKLLSAALRLRPGRRTILSERENFPTDLYVAQGLVAALGGAAEFRSVPRSELLDALDPDVAVLALTHADFRSGELHDMRALTEAAHRCGALVLWDLSHSAGVVPVDLGGCGADLAVGCGYKYLNGGPGAPAYAFVARSHHDALVSPLWGWLGHEAPFAFEMAYRPARGIARLVCGTPPILSLAALDEGVALVRRAGVEAIRAKSIALTGLFIALVRERAAGLGLELASPPDEERRGSQVSLRHADAYAIVQALVRENVIGDFRAPDLLRFGLAPLYLRYADVWDAVERLVDVVGSGRFDRDEYRRRAKVT